MKKLQQIYPLYVKQTKGKGWGVYCAKRIAKGKTFETAPIIYLPRKFIHRMSKTPIDSYRFEWRGDSTAIVLGYGSLYNHAPDEVANCEYRINKKSQTFSFYAVKDIPANTEITHDYNWAVTDYTVRGMKPKVDKDKPHKRTSVKKPTPRRPLKPKK